MSKQIIKTTQPVSVNTRDGRSSEMKIVYAMRQKTEIYESKYIILINEYVIDQLSNGKKDANGDDVLVDDKRIVLGGLKRERTDTQIRELIAILQDDAQLTELGLSDYIGMYATLDQVDRNKFVADVAHLIENNRDQVRGVNWELHEG